MNISGEGLLGQSPRPNSARPRLRVAAMQAAECSKRRFRWEVTDVMCAPNCAAERVMWGNPRPAVQMDGRQGASGLVRKGPGANGPGWPERSDYRRLNSAAAAAASGPTMTCQPPAETRAAPRNP